MHSPRLPPTRCARRSVCAATGASTLGEAWSKALGERSAWVPQASLAAICLGSCAAYSIIIGDTFSSLAASIGAKGFAASRHAAILATTAGALT